MLRTSPAHIIDLVPTVLELADVEQPQQWREQLRPPLPGKSLTATRNADSEIVRDELYWHHEGNRALRIGDMKLVSERENKNAWELYDLSRDRSEKHDLAADRPQEVQSMAERWQQLDDQFKRQASAE
jgi:arylsulfatase A-like enzyme